MNTSSASSDKNEIPYLKTILIVAAVIVVLYFFVTAENEYVCDNKQSYDSTDSEDTKEPYIVYSYPKYCTNCGDLTKYQCNRCVDCGYCYNSDGIGECVPGDANGPYFREDCVAYDYKGDGYKTNIVYPSGYYPGWPYYYWDDGFVYGYDGGLYPDGNYNGSWRRWHHRDRDHSHWPKDGHKPKDWPKDGYKPKDWPKDGYKPKGGIKDGVKSGSIGSGSGRYSGNVGGFKGYSGNLGRSQTGYSGGHSGSFGGTRGGVSSGMGGFSGGGRSGVSGGGRSGGHGGRR